MINCHTHTFRSHDSDADPFAICESAEKNRLAGLIFSDHCDCEFCCDANIIGQFSACKKDFDAVSAVYSNRLKLYFGIELGDPLFAPSFAETILRSFDFDAVMLADHAVRFPEYSIPFSRIDFGFADDAFIEAYLHRYFTDLLESVKTFDFDILCHLTVPLRYIILKYHKKVDLAPFRALIDEILRETVQRDKTLEINTSAVELPGGFLMPDAEIIDRYIALGGRSFSVGSDAHTARNVALGLDSAAGLLRARNIKSLCCYENRQRLLYGIE